jgi:hypothetical protein
VQQQGLAKKLRGHYGYYGVVGNYEALGRFLHVVKGAWRHWLDRRSRHARMTWEKMHQLLKRYPLPQPRITHPYLPRVAKS